MKSLELARAESAEFRKIHEKTLQDQQQKIDDQVRIPSWQSNNKNATLRSKQEEFLLVSESLKNSQICLKEIEDENQKIKEIIEGDSDTKHSQENLLTTL